MNTLFDHFIQTTRRIELIDITALVRKSIRESGVHEGICIVFVQHTTAGITINENADPDVCSDMDSFFKKLVPNDRSFKHSEGNSDSHIKSTLFGPSLSLIIHESQPLLGTWQGIYFAEFDGPRQRKLSVKCIAG